MLFKGTAKRPTAREIAIAIERIGGIFNASTGQEESTYWAKVTQPHPDMASDVLGEGMSSRLFTGIREKRGLAYSVNSYISALYDTGVVGV